MSKSKKNTKSVEETISATFIQNLYTSFVADGYIDPRGKSDTELKKEFWALARRFANQKTIYGITIHYEDLLKEARQYVRREREEMACLFYATWFEHWVNHLVMTRGRQTSLSNDEVKILSGIPAFVQSIIVCLLS
jgi:hypothetical protein